MMKKLNGKTTNFSCRMDSETLSILEKESKTKGISINSLINSVLEHYVSLDRHSKDIQLISLTQRAIKKIFEDMSDAEIKKLSNEVGGFVHRELVFLKYGELTFDNLMKVIEINSTRYGSVIHTEDNHLHKFCIHHNAGINFSKFISFIHGAMTDKLSLRFRITNCDENIICMEISEPLRRHFEKN